MNSNELLGGDSSAGKSAIAKKLESGEFIVTVEVHPPRGHLVNKTFNSIKALLEKVQIDAFNTTDIPLAQARLSSTAMSSLITSYFSVDTIMHVATRYRNVLSLQSDLLGAHALGVSNVFVFMGDPPAMGDATEASSLSDVTSSELISLISDMNSGIGLGGVNLNQATNFTVGCAINLEADDMDKELESLKRKVDAGAQFILSQTVFDAEPVEKVAELTKGFPIPLVLGVLPLRSHKHASFLNNSVPGMTVPQGVLDRLYNAEGDVGLEGVRIAQEILNKSISIIGGAYLVPAFNRYDYVAEVISGLANVD
tara:strand:- start:684 stop:1616 length:933 start_codon:yes stop_codon:yes gene_type:complete